MRTAMLDEILKQGEDSKTEFKNERFRSEQLGKEVVAFANVSGGTIWLGIDADGVISGVDDPKAEERVVNICRNSVEPGILPEVYAHIHGGKKVYEVVIPKGSSKPYKLKGTNKFYVRAGSASVEPTTEELIRLFQAGSLLHFEVSSISGSSQLDIDVLRFRDYLDSYRRTEFDMERLEELLFNLQISDDQAAMSFVGALFFAKDVGRFIPQSGVQLFHFEGEHRNANIIDHREVSTSLPELIETAYAFVEKTISIKGEFCESTAQRQDVADYDLFSVRELITNAFIHRDWSIFGQKVRISIFNDRIEFFSPGGLPNTLNLQRAMAGISYYRNPIVAQMAKDYGLVEKAGRGLSKVSDLCRKQGIPQPEFECENEYVRVTLFKRI